MTNRKLGFAALLAAVAAFSVAACGPQPEATTETPVETPAEAPMDTAPPVDAMSAAPGDAMSAAPATP